MDRRKKQALERLGWRTGTVQEFLGLTDAEALMIEIRLILANALVDTRQARGLTQHEVARAVGSSQSRVAKMERGDPSVSLDLLLHALLELGATPRQVGKAISGAKVA